MKLSSSELILLAETLDTAHLRAILPGNTGGNRKPRKQKSKADETPPHPLAKLTREELLAQVVSVAGTHPGTLHRLCEAVSLSPKQARIWLSEREPDAPRAWIEKTVQLLERSYHKGHQPVMIPATTVVGLLSIGLAQVLEDLTAMERELSGLPATAPPDVRTLLVERHRREELRILLAGIGAPDPMPFCPDDFQLEAVDLVLNQATDVMVSAPTGSGKTWIAEQAIRGTLQRGQTAWYTSPLKALSNDKFREFGRIFGRENVGIITGDRRINPDAPLKIATTEIYRNGLYDAMNGLEVSDQKFSLARLVVFDEVHYLGDRERGVVWEESIIYTPPDARILMLSATVGNAQELADWVAWTRGTPCRLVFHPERPVPLRTAFVHPNARLTPLLSDSETGSRLHPDVQTLYSHALYEMESRDNRRRPFYRKRF